MVTTKNNSLIVVTLAGAALISATGVGAAAGSIQTCTVGASCTAGEFVYDDSYAPVTGGTCTITSRYPDGTVHINAAAMTGATDGWYSYGFTAPTTTGYYRAQVCCTIGTDYMCLDKSWEVVAAAATVPTAGDIASAVWGYSSRTMAGFGNLISDLWSHTGRTLTGSQATNITNITSTITQTRTLLEQLVNKPVVQNFIEEDIPEVGAKIEETKQTASQLFMSGQYVVSKTGVLFLKWGQLSDGDLSKSLTEIEKTLGEETDSAATNTLFGQLASLKRSWGWKELDVVLTQARVVKAALADRRFAGVKSLTSYTAGLEKAIGEVTDRVAEVEKLAAVLEERQAEADKMLAGGTSPTRVNELTKAVLAVNRLPKGDMAIVPSFQADTAEKRLKNRLLAIRGLIGANKKFLAKGMIGWVDYTWLEVGSVVFKSLVTNPSSLISQTVSLKYYLPAEIKKEDILQSDAGLEVKFDAEKNQYYVEGEFLLKPGESRTLAVRTADIWVVSQDAVDSARKQAVELARPLEKTAYFAQSITLKSDIDVALDKVVALQKEVVTPEQKIRAYREASIEMNGANAKMDKLKELVTQASASNSLFGFVGGAQAMSVWGLIIILVAGFVFLALYMRTLNGHVNQEVVEVKRREGGGRIAVAVMVGVLSAGISGVISWKVNLVTAPTVLGVGGPDIVRVTVPENGTVNVLQTASATSGVVMRLKTTMEVIRLGEDAKWAQVTPEDQSWRGWVAREFVVEPVDENSGR